MDPRDVEVMPECNGGGGEVTEDGVFDADGVRMELTLKSDEGFGEVSTVLVVAVESDDVVEVGGVLGGVAGGELPELVASVASELLLLALRPLWCCSSWSRIIAEKCSLPEH